MGTRQTTTTLTIGVLALVLTGCTPTAAGADSAPPAPQSGAGAGDSGPAGPASPTVASPGACDPTTSTHPVTDPTDPEQLGGRSLAVPQDAGPVPTASGEAILNGDGVPVAYLVASGDALSTVAARFCVTEDWLQLINHARRDNDALYAGDTLNLDPHTIFSVGDQNGVVSHNTFTDGYALPPQR